MGLALAIQWHNKCPNTLVSKKARSAKTPMLDLILGWYERHFSDPQAVILAFLLVSLFALIMVFGGILAPALVALVLAYLLEGLVGLLTRLGLPRTPAVVVVILVFIALSLILMFGVVPVLSFQVSQVIRALPNMIVEGQEQLLKLPDKYPEVFTVEQINDLIGTLRAEIGQATQEVVEFSFGQIQTLVAVGVYVVLVPMMVFFTLKDKHQLMKFAQKFLPRRSELSFRVWREVDIKIANYIRGKFVEIAIIWLASYLVFEFTGLDYSLLLSLLVGISVIVPYIGAVVVTVPIALIAYFQWGLTAQFWWLMLYYQILQILDGNALVPLLFSEVVNLHPLAIILAVMFFGGLFGLWGVFFAIPLATLAQTVLKVWPKYDPRKARSSELEPPTATEAGAGSFAE